VVSWKETAEEDNIWIFSNWYVSTKYQTPD
jgi:hypothetical protein